MGTKLQPAIDLLATKSHVTASAIRESMERTLKQRGVETVKTTMLKQEEIFKQQVRELHRLYRVQRMLMDELKNKTEPQNKHLKTLTTASQGTVGLGYGFLAQNERDHAWERSGSCSGGDSETRNNAKRSTGGFDFDIIRSANQQEDNSTRMRIIAGSSSSCSTIKPGSSRITGASHARLEEELCGLDLTLTIGGGGGSVKKRLRELQDDQCIGLECSDAGKLDRKSQELQLQPQPSLSTAMRSSTTGTQKL